MRHCTCESCAAADAGKRLRERQRRREAGCYRPAGDAAEGASPCAGSVLCCMVTFPAAAAMLTSRCCHHAASVVRPAACMSSQSLPRERRRWCEGPKPALPCGCVGCGSRQRSRRVGHARRHLSREKVAVHDAIHMILLSLTNVNAAANVRHGGSSSAPGLSCAWCLHSETQLLLLLGLCVRNQAPTAGDADDGASAPVAMGVDCTQWPAIEICMQGNQNIAVTSDAAVKQAPDDASSERTTESDSGAAAGELSCRHTTDQKLMTI